MIVSRRIYEDFNLTNSLSNFSKFSISVNTADRQELESQCSAVQWPLQLCCPFRVRVAVVPGVVPPRAPPVLPVPGAGHTPARLRFLPT